MERDKLETLMKLYQEYKLNAAQLESETKRNNDNSDLFEAMIREAYENVSLVATGHHFIFKMEGHKIHGEIPSADALIFDHSIAQKLWKDRYKEILSRLALEPVESRDELLRNFYYNR